MISISSIVAFHSAIWAENSIHQVAAAVGFDLQAWDVFC